MVFKSNPKPTKKLKAPFPKAGKNAIKPKMGPGPDKGLNGPVGKIVGKKKK